MGAYLCSLPFSNAQENYAAFELARDNNWDQLITEDIDGDDRKDLIFSHYDPLIGRELKILRQREDGSFSSEPQSIEIKTEIISKALKIETYSPKKFFSVSKIKATTFNAISIEIK